MLIIMNQILKQANAIFVLKQKETSLSFYILHLLFIYVNYGLIITFEDSFVNHSSVKLISSIKIIIIMNQIINQANAICFKLKKTCLCLNNIKSIVCLYMNQIIKQVNAICFKSACCFNHGTCLHL